MRVLAWRQPATGVTGQFLALATVGPSLAHLGRIEQSRDLMHWEPFATVPIPASGQTLIDPAAISQAFLFDRAVTVP